MNEATSTVAVGYEYLEKPVPAKWFSMYIDSYQNFGWEDDPHSAHLNAPGQAAGSGVQQITQASADAQNTLLRLRRNRKQPHRMELDSLQRKFESLMSDVIAADNSAKTMSTVVLWGFVLAGLTAFAFDMLAITTSPVHVLRILVLSAFAVICFIVGPTLSKSLLRKNQAKANNEINAICEKIYGICQDGAALRKEEDA